MESTSSQVSAESCSDFTFAFNNIKFSDRTLQVQILPDYTVSETDLVPDNDSNDKVSNYFNFARLSFVLGGFLKLVARCFVHEAVNSNENSSSTDDSAGVQVKDIHITTAILAAKSPFFYKAIVLEWHVGVKRAACNFTDPRVREEAAFMDLLKFMYTNTLSSTTASTILDVLMAADKYEVASCMKYCFQILPKLPMTCELALLYLDLPSTILMADTVHSLTNAAKEFLVTCFKDTNKFQEDILNLHLAGIEAILSSDDLQVDSEDIIHDFVMKWAQRHYTKHSERQEILNTRLLRLIRFEYLSCEKLKELLSCTDINPKCSSEFLFEALAFQMSLVSPKKERAYKLRPVKVIGFHSPRDEFVVYLDLKREECARLLPYERIYSCNFHCGGKMLYLLVIRHTEKHSLVYSFGLYLGMREIGSMVEYEFSTRAKPSEEFVANGKSEYKYTECIAHGNRNLYDMPWDTFIAEDSPYFINGVLHLRAVIKFKKE